MHAPSLHKLHKSGGETSSVFPCPCLHLSDHYMVFPASQSLFHPNPSAFHAYEGLGATKKETPVLHLNKIKTLRNWASSALSGICPIQKSLTREHCSGTPFSLTQRQRGSPGSCLLMLSIFQLLLCLLFERPFLSSERVR